MQHYYIGRQPIFDVQQNVIGYELLYRRQEQTTQARVIDGDQATSQIFINSFLEMGLDKVVGKHQAFINVTRHFITNIDLLPPPSSQLVLEILEDIEIDNTIISAVRKLKQMGYIIALDDFIYHPDLKPLVNEANIVKLDVQALNDMELEEHVSILNKYPIKLLAEKIETPEMFDRCKGLSFDYFQGYFLCKPRVLTGRRMPANRVNTMRMMAELQNPAINIKELEALISQDPTMSYKLMRYINSAAFTLSKKVDSIHHAIVYLGEKEIKRWATLIALTGIDDKPDELITTSLIRSKMCELLAESCSSANKDSAFIVGLFSTLDAMMDRPLPEILGALPLSPEITEALISRKGPYAAILNSVIAYEHGEWDKLESTAISKETITEIYLNSLNWADTIMQGIKAETTH
ncbi:MAG: HDOD domain-containing protein [Gammaproteobacteria bacterium]|nr:HDOD domain-containing protein [Gammaproteobacteria bacterium]